VSSEDSVHSIECGTDVRQEGDRFRLVAVRLSGPRKTIESSIDEVRGSLPAEITQPPRPR
jgi:hypothetical protein